MRCYPPSQTPAFDDLHTEVMLPIMLADFVDGDNVRMIQIGRRFRFAV